uniref:Uncharacterized protein n=1 Tax=Oryza rufipogon TaxID=4529 RepID=A0A0E0PPN9_ORYRU
MGALPSMPMCMGHRSRKRHTIHNPEDICSRQKGDNNIINYEDEDASGKPATYLQRIDHSNASIGNA